MKIAHLIDYFHPGMGYQENHVAKLQAGAGHKVWIICGDLFTPWDKAPGREFLESVSREDLRMGELGVKVVRLPCAFEYRHRLWLSGLGAALEAINPDFLHVHSVSSFNSLRACAMKKRLACRLMIDDHMLFIASEHFAAKAFYFLFRLFVSKYIQAHTDRIVAVSDETIDFMAQMYGIPQVRIEMIPLGVDTATFHPDEDLRRQKRQEVGVGSDEVVLIYTGKINALKDPMKAVEAAIPLWGRGLKFRFFLVGMVDKEYQGRVDACVAAVARVDGDIQFLPFVPSGELPAFFNMADIAVWPCKSSMSALEAMACGCPVVLSHSKVNAERGGDGRGLTYDGSVADLSRKLELAMTDHAVRCAMGEKGVMYTKALSWESINLRLIEGEEGKCGEIQP